MRDGWLFRLIVSVLAIGISVLFVQGMLTAIRDWHIIQDAFGHDTPLSRCGG